MALRLRPALQAMQHRGPDDEGLEVESVAGGTLALGHKRLSIIDLSPGGHQPMHSHDGRYTIVYNGEIYNYKELRKELRGLGHLFRTESDTEVLMAAWAQWGAGCLVRLTGMFAFAMFDRQAQTLTLARDAFGIKPLYYSVEPGTFSFASELPALMAVSAGPPRLNLQRAHDYLVWGSYDDQAGSFYEGVLHLPPGHWAAYSFDDKVLSAPVRWWWPSVQERRDLSLEHAAGQLRDMFLTNVRLHLRSDVPLGAALSGGIDSSALVCAMRLLEPEAPIHTFTFVARGTAVDEEHWADAIIRHTGATAHKVVVAPEEMARDIDAMILAQGEPFGSTSIYAQYRVFQLAREKGITVTLDGQGADELLAGYRHYAHGRMASLLDRAEYGKLLRFMWEWSKWPGRGLRLGARMALRKAFREGRLPFMKWKHGPQTMKWLNTAYLDARGVSPIPVTGAAAPPDARGRRLASTLRNDLTSQGLQSLLRHGDRNAMHWSLESRVPFLTTDMAEFLLSLPEHYLISQTGETKTVFRHAMRGIVPDAILDRRDKIGFVTPEQDWLRSLGDTTLKWVEAANDIPFLDAGSLRDELNGAFNQRGNFDWTAWRLLNFCRWYELFRPVI